MGYDPRQRRADVAWERPVVFDEQHETTDDELRASMPWSDPNHDVMGDIEQAWRDAPVWHALRIDTIRTAERLQDG